MSKNELIDLSDAMAQAVEKAAGSTLMVDARRRLPASGIAIKKDLVLTANHIVQRDEDIKVTLPDGTELSAEVAGRDPGSDLCLLRLPEEAAQPAQTNGEPVVGQLALALGRPSTEGIQASFGIVSAFGGPVHTRRGGTLEQYIRTDAIPYPGFSGGPLINAEGLVIGLNTSGLGHGNSIAIPIEYALKIAGWLEEHGSIKRGYLGISSKVVDLPDKADLDREQNTGLLVFGLEEDSPAAAAEVMTGDIVVGFNDRPITDHETLFAAMTGEVVGQPAPLEVLRGGKPETLEVTLTERAEAPRPRSSQRRGPWRKFPGASRSAHYGRRHGPRAFKRHIKDKRRSRRSQMRRHFKHHHDEHHGHHGDGGHHDRETDE
jgi:S1-C subfamily serine protease